MLSFLFGPKVDAAQIRARVEAGEMLLVDVRGADEYARGHAKGALNLPGAMLEQHLKPGVKRNPARDLDHPIALYCASGARSGAAKRRLQAMGYRDVTNLGGLSRWSRAGGEVVR